MTHISTSVVITALVALFIPSAPLPSQSAAASIRWEPYTVKSDNHSEAAELGRLLVPTRHAQPSGATMTLALVRLKSLSPTPAAPIIYLDGGPGGSGVSTFAIPEMFALYQRLRTVADVIVVSQRGTGQSSPRPTCPSSGPLLDDTFTTVARMREVFMPRFAECAQRVRSAGADLGAFNTEESADDIEAVRVALGADKISLLGFSYGTHLGLSVMRRHGAHVARAVLSNVEGPDQTQKLPSVFDTQLDAIAAIARADAAAGRDMPDLVDALKRLLAKVRAEPIALTLGPADKPRRILVGEAGLLYILRRDIGDTNDTPWIPSFVYETLNGNYARLTQMAARRFPPLEGAMNLMGEATDCASGVSAARRAVIEAQERTSIWSHMINAPFPEVCDAIGVSALGDAFREPVVSDVPTLLISGTLDSNTPPDQTNDTARTLSRSTHLVVANAGHETPLSTSAVHDVIVDFFTGKDVSGRRVSLPAPKILPIRR